MISKVKRSGFITLATLLFAGLQVQAQTAAKWKLDKAHTSVNFTIKHFFSDVTGKFKDFEGTFIFDPTNLESSQIRFTILVASVVTEDTKRDRHLQSKDFFDARHYPEITFVSTSLEKHSSTEYIAHGSLTIKETRKNIAIPIKITGEMEHPMMKGTKVLGMAVKTRLNRTDFGVGTGNWATTMVVGDEVDINIPLELNRKI